MSLLLVGVGHVFRLEEPLTRLIERERPDVVALELDPGRYAALVAKSEGTYDPAKALEKAPRLYRNLAKFQEEIAGGMGVQVGGEMLAGARAARAVGSQVALIDRSADESVRRLWSEMRFREKLKLAVSGLVARLRLRKAENVEEEIARYQKDPGSYLEELGREYPTVKRVLLDERNDHMAKNLRGLVARPARVLALVGDGHVDGLVRILADLQPRVVRLSELRDAAPGDLAWRLDPDGAGAGFSFEGTTAPGDLRRDP